MPHTLEVGIPKVGRVLLVGRPGVAVVHEQGLIHTADDIQLDPGHQVTAGLGEGFDLMGQLGDPVIGGKQNVITVGPGIGLQVGIAAEDDRHRKCVDRGAEVGAVQDDHFSVRPVAVVPSGINSNIKSG
jgi:hypothetical protein